MTQKGDVMLAMESHCLMIGFVELVKANIMFEGLSRALKTNIFSLWVETNRKN